MPSASARSSLEARISQYQARVGEVRSFLERRGITAETAEKFRLGFDGDRLCIPYLTPAGPWQIKKRCIQDHNCKDVDGHAKYGNDPGVGTHLFNAAVLLDADRVVVVEGELDAVACWQAGIPAVAYPGANNWQKHFRFCFDSCDEVVVVADGDEPGRKAAAHVAESLRQAISGDVRVVVMPAEAKDASEFINLYGGEQFLAEIGWLE